MTPKAAAPGGSPPEGFDALAELALDLRWSWNHAADHLWRDLDPALWELTHNPWVILQTVSKERLGRALAQPAVRREVDALLEEKRRAAEGPAWFQQAHPRPGLGAVAYFSMEFMLSEALPIYSGGLGNVAGDQLKAASDLGVPVVGVGLLYQQGYFRQIIDRAGGQQALYPYNDPGQLPITPLRDASGEWIRIELKLPGYAAWLRAWQVRVGRVRLLLLDTNDAANLPAHRGITGELYGGGPELRLKQELALGLGGWRLLRAAGFRPEVCHLNEGHAAFAVLERAREFMAATGQPFPAALAATRAGNLFTTHTAVPAGFDRFPPEMVEHYLGGYARELGLSARDLLALGRRNADDAGEAFNMAYLALRGSGAANGVSRLHGQVSRRIFAPLFPRWPEAEVPVGHVTNGVHMPSWDSQAADAVWTAACGARPWLGVNSRLESGITAAPAAALWDLRTTNRKALVGFVRDRLARELALGGAAGDEVESARHVFDPNALTLGFARRFATYKRPNLLLRDPGRLLRLLADPERPVQLVIAGKAHPADEPGQEMIREWIRFIRGTEARARVVFLADYDMLLTEQLVQGVDVWLNTPRRPWEASGTSGMKVLVNGGLNLSELDGWWAEADDPAVGWAVGDGNEHGEDAAWDAAEADQLYRILEREVVPEFYARDAAGLPAAWVERVRASMARLTPRFSAARTVQEYCETYYLPAARAYRERAAENGEGGSRIARWREGLDRHWPNFRFGKLSVRTAGSSHEFEVEVFLGDADPASVRVELYAEGEAEPREMSAGDHATGPGGATLYGAQAPAARPASDYTPRLVPRCSGVRVPLEAGHILWQR
ncbi:MAG TPA: alpha-glucan family phosphorylase [Opitutaceae bacterium]|nr:alpha-glucan family phosphorylase [Opitutaceae bacterium]